MVAQEGDLLLLKNAFLWVDAVAWLYAKPQKEL